MLIFASLTGDSLSCEWDKNLSKTVKTVKTVKTCPDHADQTDWNTRDSWGIASLEHSRLLLRWRLGSLNDGCPEVDKRPAESEYEYDAGQQE